MLGLFLTETYKVLENEVRLRKYGLDWDTFIDVWLRRFGQYTTEHNTFYILIL